MIDKETDRLLAMVPCQLMKGTVQVKDPATLSHLHVLTLRAMSEHSDLKEILEAFGVGRRVMQGVVADLFYAGLVYLNLRKGEAAVAPHVRDAIAKGELEAFLSIRAPREVEMIWVREMVSGGLMVYPFVSRNLTRPDYVSSTINLAPKPGRVSSLKDLPARILAKVAAPLLEEQVPLGGSVVDRIERITDRRLVGSRTFYVPVRILRPKADEEPILLPEVRGVPRPILDAWTAVLNPKREPLELLANLAVHRDPFRAALPDGMAEDWKELVGRLRRGLLSTGASPRDADHAEEMVRDLNDLARQITVSRQIARSASAVAGSAPVHFAALRQVLQDAKDPPRLIIIGSAFMKPKNLHDMVTLLLPSVQRGAKAILLWGLADVGEEAEEVETLHDAQRILGELTDGVGLEGDGGIWILPSESPFHSKFVAVDDTTAMVSSLNWLSSGAHGTTWEATILLDGGPLPAEILAYGLERIPSNHPAHAAAEKAMSKPLSDKIGPDEEPWTQIAHRLSAIIVEGELGGPLPELSRSLDEAEQVAGAIRAGHSGLLVTDGEHRRLLTSGLANAQSSLLVTSDRVRGEGVGRVLESLLGECIERGVMVSIRWGRELPGESPDDDARKSLERVRTLTSNLGVRLDINADPIGIHGKVFIVDDAFCLVSSFNFLAFGGVAGRGRTLSGELGLVVHRPDIAKAFRTSLEAHCRSHAP